MSGKNGVVEASPEPSPAPGDDRHEDRGRPARQGGREPDVRVSRGLLVSFAPYVATALVAGLGGGVGGARFNRPDRDEGKLDQVIAVQKETSQQLKDIGEAQKRIETRLTTLEAQGTSAQVEKIEARLRLAEEELAALRALQGRGK